MCFKTIQIILTNSETFEDFYRDAEDILYKHYKEINAQREVFEDDVKDYSKELWDEHANNSLPF